MNEDFNKEWKWASTSDEPKLLYREPKPPKDFSSLRRLMAYAIVGGVGGVVFGPIISAVGRNLYEGLKEMDEKADYERDVDAVREEQNRMGAQGIYYMSEPGDNIGIWEGLEVVSSSIKESSEEHLRLMRAINNASNFFPRNQYWQLRKDNGHPTFIYPARELVIGNHRYPFLYASSQDGSDLIALELPEQPSWFHGGETDNQVTGRVLYTMVYGLLARNLSLVQEFLYPHFRQSDENYNAFHDVVASATRLMLGESTNLSKELTGNFAHVLNRSTGSISMSPRYEELFAKISGTSNPVSIAREYMGWYRDGE